MLQFISMIQDIHPGIFVHSVRIDEDLGKDKQAGFVRDCSLNDITLANSPVSTEMRMTKSSWFLSNLIQYRNCKGDLTLWVYHKV